MECRFSTHAKAAPTLSLLLLAIGAINFSSRHVASNFDKQYKSITKSFAVGPIISSSDEPAAKRAAVQLRNTIYRELKKRQTQYWVVIQPLSETERRVNGAGLSDSACAQMPPVELCQLLGVDAVLRGNVEAYLEKKLFLGGEVVVAVAINHASFGQTIWQRRMQKRAKTGFGNPVKFVDQMGKEVAKTFPFSKAEDGGGTTF